MKKTLRQRDDTQLHRVRVHRVKVWPEVAVALHAGKKTAELRRHDRDYRAGDILELVEFEPRTCRSASSHIWMITGVLLPKDSFGALKAGYCMLSLRRAPHHVDAIVGMGMRGFHAVIDVVEPKVRRKA